MAFTVRDCWTGNMPSANGAASHDLVEVRKATGAIKAILLDMDGVLYRGETILEGVLEFLAWSEDMGIRLLYVTNNATKTPSMFVDKLAAMGIEAQPDQIITSAEATAGWMARNVRPGSKVQIVGGPGVWNAMITRGFQPANSPQAADFVVVGMDFNLDYRKCAEATLAIAAGADFIATNVDSTFPSEEGNIPGAGAIVSLLQTASGVEPTVIGKPSPGMFEEAMARLSLQPHECLMVGDRYETDIEGAQKIGIWTLGIGTGITSVEEFLGKDQPPNFVVQDMVEFLDLCRGSNLLGCHPTGPH